jgi:hypothetical protein
MKPVTATWTVELNCDCPHCGEWVDVLEGADFWDAHHGSLEIAEHNTERSRNVAVQCPLCEKDFEIDCEY